MPPAAAGAIFWIATACCLVAQIAVIRSAIRAPMPGSDATPVKMPRRPLEILWTIIPAIVLALVLVSTWNAMHRRMEHQMLMPAGHRMIEE